MTVSNPYIDYQVVPASEQVQQEKHKILFVGQMTAAGTATPLTLYKSFLNDKSWQTKFGKDSQISLMMDAAKKINNVTRMDAIPLADNDSGDAATGSVEFKAGTATENVTIYVTVASRNRFRLPISVQKDDLETDVADSLLNAINENDFCPVNALATLGVVDLTAVNKGLDGNEITLEIEGEIPGIGYVLTGMSGGTLVPDVTEIETIIEKIRYNTIVMSANYDIASFSEFLENRMVVSNRLLMGVNFCTKADSDSNLINFGNAFDPSRSSQVLFPNKLVGTDYYQGTSIRETGTVISAQFAAIRGLRLTKDANVSRYVIARDAPNDAIGGEHMCSKPYAETPFYDLPVIYEAAEWTDDEQVALFDAGYSIIGNNEARNRVVCSNVRTMYKEDVASNEDDSFRYLNYRDESDVSIEYMYDSAKQQFRQARLTDGAVIPLVTMDNASTIAGAFEDWYRDLAGLDYLAVRIGKEQITLEDGTKKTVDPYITFKTSLQVILNIEEGSANVSFKLPIMSQLRKLIITQILTFALQSS